jgi:hypothetical protein
MKNISLLFCLLFSSLFFSSNEIYGDWVQTTTFADSDNINCFATIPGESGVTNLFVGTANGVFLSTNDGTTWTAVNTGLTNLYVLSLAVSGSDLFVGTKGGIFFSTKYGADWTAINTGLTDLNVLAIAISGQNLLAGTFHGGLCLSTNYGASWTPLGVNAGYIKAFAISGQNIFAGTTTGVIRSIDNGITWNSANTGLTVNVLSFAVSGNNLFAATSTQGVYLSTNDGTNWTALNTGLIDLDGESLAISDQNLFVGTWGGVYHTGNAISWSKVSSGLPPLPKVRSIIISGTNLFAGTYGNGVWRRSLNEMITDVKEIVSVPIEFSLNQNYPNPFNPATKIMYSVPKDGNLRLEVYNVIGQKVAELVNEYVKAGKYDINFDGSNFTSGVYLYKMELNGRNEIKKMILLK